MNPLAATRTDPVSVLLAEAAVLIREGALADFEDPCGLGSFCPWCAVVLAAHAMDPLGADQLLQGASRAFGKLLAVMLRPGQAPVLDRDQALAILGDALRRRT